MISTCFILILLCHPTEVKAGLDGSLFSLDLDCVQLVRSAFIMFVGSQKGPRARLWRVFSVVIWNHHCPSGHSCGLIILLRPCGGGEGG